jgi:peroxiredoxin Q/BCP
MGAFQKDIESFERLDTQVLGISPDSMDSHYEFAEELNLTFPLISDPDKKLIRVYSGGRIAYFIDKKGMVQMIVKGMPKNIEILEKIKQLEN